MLLQVTNPGTDDVLTTIPCGLIFQPDDTEQQRLMVVQAYSATVKAGRQADLKPYIVCIDSSKHAPAEHAPIPFGNMASGDLLALAACVCTQPLTFEKDFPRELGLQFAVWHTSDPEFPGNAGDSPLGRPSQPFIKWDGYRQRLAEELRLEDDALRRLGGCRIVAGVRCPIEKGLAGKRCFPARPFFACELRLVYGASIIRLSRSFDDYGVIPF
jgi:hypothetical protein